MNMNSLEDCFSVDPTCVINRIKRFPDEIELGFQQGKELNIPLSTEIEHLYILATGEAALAGDLLAGYLREQCPVLVSVCRDGSIPGWLKKAQALVVIFTPGMTPTAIQGVLRNLKMSHCRVILVSDLSTETGLENTRYVHYPLGEPLRHQAGWALGFLLGLSQTLGLGNHEGEVPCAVQDLRAQIEHIQPSVPVNQNPASRMAGQLLNRLITIVAADNLRPAAVYWKEKFNTLAKQWTQVEFLPEMNAAALAVLTQPDDLLEKMVVVFLRGSASAENQLRSDLTQQGFLMEGIPTDVFEVQARSRLSRILSTAHFGEFVAYYLAIFRQVNPASAPLMEMFAQLIADPA